MVSIRFLEPYRDDDACRRIASVGTAAGLSNIFNVSVVFAGGTMHCVFRALAADGQKPFRAYYLAIPEGERPTALDENAELVDLTAHGAGYGVAPVADPKLLVLDDSVYATFNTGQPADGASNDVYLMRVSPSLGIPQRCVLADRQRVEKNWSFALTEEGLVALYGLAPLATLVLEQGELGGSTDLEFRKAHTIGDASRIGVSLSIGTQLVRVEGGYAFICHEKIGVRSRRAYLGRLARVQFADGRFTDLRLSRVRLVHSWRAALPHRPKHNRALISATYFAGLQVRGQQLRLSYGINDIDYSVAEIEEAVLWA